MPRPKAEDFKDEAISGAVLKGTIAHPVTIWSGGAAALGVVAGLALSPVGWLVAAGAGVVGLGSLVAKNCFQYKKLAREHVQKLLEERRKDDQRQLAGLSEFFERIGFEQGLKEAEDLWTAYESLVRLLDENSDYLDPEASQYRTSADSLFQAAIHNLRLSGELFRTLSDIDADALRRELKTHQARQRRSSDESSERQCQTLQSRIDDYERSHTRFQERLASANEIEGTLHRAAQKLSDLGIGHTAGGSIDWNTAAGQLNSGIQAAVESDQELQEIIAGRR